VVVYLAEIGIAFPLAELHPNGDRV
jgi:hypothetical protein